MRIEAFAPRDADWKILQRAAQAAEEMGFDDFATPEITNDPFVSLAMAALATHRIGLRTAIAVAFPRSPMITAYSAWELHVNSGGRMRLGLGTQVKGHNERRFSVPWVAPAARLEEYVRALRAIWHAWETRGRLDFRGEHYQFTLMTPEFAPRPSGLLPIPIYTAGVRPRMLELAGRVADGVRLHGFCTRRYLLEVALPSIERGLAASGRSREHFEVCGGGFIATGPDQAGVDRMREWVRHRVAFYASTRSYLPVLELHGWEGLGQRLHEMSKAGRWKEMPAAVPDEVLDAFTVAATYDELPAAVAVRFGGLCDSIELALDQVLSALLPTEVMAALRAIPCRFSGAAQSRSAPG